MQLSIHGSISDSGDGLALVCGRCGRTSPITAVGSVRVYVHALGIVIAFDIAYLSKVGEFSLLCDECTQSTAKGRPHAVAMR